MLLPLGILENIKGTIIPWNIFISDDMDLNERAWTEYVR